MLPLGRIFFPLKVALLRCGFLYIETYSTVQKLVFDDIGTKVLKVCVYLLLIA